MINLNEKKPVDSLLQLISDECQQKGVDNLTSRQTEIWNLVQQIRKDREEEKMPDTESSIHAKIEVLLHGSKDEIKELIEGDFGKFHEIISRGDVTIDEDNLDPMYVPIYVADCWCEENDLLELKYGNTVD